MTYRPMDAQRMGKMLLLSVRPTSEWKDGTRIEGVQRKDDSGVPLWDVQVVVLPMEKGRSADVMYVRVPAPVEPDIMPGSEVVFLELGSSSWWRNGRSGETITARAVSEA